MVGGLLFVVLVVLVLVLVLVVVVVVLVLVHAVVLEYVVAVDPRNLALKCSQNQISIR